MKEVLVILICFAGFGTGFAQVKSRAEKTNILGLNGTITMAGSQNAEKGDSVFLANLRLGILKLATFTDVFPDISIPDARKTKTYVDIINPPFFIFLPKSSVYQELSTKINDLLILDKATLSLDKKDSVLLTCEMKFDFVLVNVKKDKMITAGKVLVTAEGSDTKELLSVIARKTAERLFGKEEKKRVENLTSWVDQEEETVRLSIEGGGSMNFYLESSDQTTAGGVTFETAKDPSVPDYFNSGGGDFFGGVKLKFFKHMELGYQFRSEGIEGDVSKFRITEMGTGSSFAPEEVTLDAVTNAFSLTYREMVNQKGNFGYFLSGALLTKSFTGKLKYKGASVDFPVQDETAFEFGGGIEFKPINPKTGVNIGLFFSTGTMKIGSSSDNLELTDQKLSLRVSLFYDFTVYTKN